MPRTRQPGLLPLLSWERSSFDRQEAEGLLLPRRWPAQEPEACFRAINKPLAQEGAPRPENTTCVLKQRPAQAGRRSGALKATLGGCGPAPSSEAPRRPPGADPVYLSLLMPCTLGGPGAAHGFGLRAVYKLEQVFHPSMVNHTLPF